MQRPICYTIVPTRTGYTFLGWASNLRNPEYYQPGAVVRNLTTIPGATITLYAIWQQNTGVQVPVTPTLPGSGSLYSLRGGSAALTAYVKTYTYDAAGNRAKMTASGTESYTTAYTYDANNRLTQETKTKSGSTAATTYFYDANGNLTKTVTSDGEVNSAYNGFDQLVSAYSGDSGTVYTYNAQGIRTGKTTPEGATTFLLDGGNVVGEIQDGTLAASYLRGVNLIRRTTTEGMEYYLFNAHGDVVGLTDGFGSLTKSNDYDAFGNEKAPDTSDTNAFRYCGEYFDKETGTYYLRARYYDPAIGRFTQQDTHWSPANAIYGDNPRKINQRQDALGLNTYAYAPKITAIMQSGNLYVYCVSNPCLYHDIAGEAIVVSALLAGAVIGGFLSGGMNIVGQLINGKSWEDLDIISIGLAVGTGALSGMLNATGAGRLVQIIGNACLAAAGSLAENLIKGEEINKANAFISALFGGFAGAAAGKGLLHNTKSVKVIGDRLVGGVNGFGLQSFTYQSSRLAQLW